MSKLTEAIARGYCTDENKNKVVDPQLVEAIAQEVEKFLESNGYHLGELASDPEPTVKSENGIQAQSLLNKFMLESQTPNYQAQKQFNELRPSIWD